MKAGQFENLQFHV